ncbi:glycine cleavage system protein R [Propionivibrio dicarboxylicus]|uniref:Glycine cleavage system regulatory protein n=1 Tax=Propionivibrio dicarboxylicus TaxID=83767 RepID=A0A1G7Y535_9RHOO|nr:ACT domain-containing protein [Propionivibrio dicarboxylicus]SDG91473.1 Glycine cleavage system regulatory protein [Propionivibrio dicarboxylicus]
MNAPTASLILTAIGDDRPGLVESLAATISRHDGNWLESSMSHLAGKFAGIVNIALPADRIDGLKADLATLQGLRVTAEISDAAAKESGQRKLKLSLVGHDRIGIVKEVSQVLARQAINVESLTTFTSSAAMSASTLFHAVAELTAAPSLDARALKHELETLSNDLMVDITLDETIN